MEAVERFYGSKSQNRQKGMGVLKKNNLQMVALILERHWNKSSSERQEETWIICEKMVLLHKIPSQGFCYQNVQKYDKVQVIFSAAHK